MPRVKVTLSANAGIAIEINGRRIWVDALHEDKQPNFSGLTPALQSKMLSCEAFFRPDYICFTHCHQDHYSRRLTLAAKAMWPEAKLCLPEPEFEDQILVTGEAYQVEANDLTLRFIRLPHEGAAYGNVKHYGLWISAEGRNILISGDCAVAAPELVEAIGKQSVDLAVMDFPWVTLGKGSAYVTQTLRPKHILLYHLPLSEDDCCGYRASANRAVGLLSKQMDIRLLSEPLQTVEINI